MNKEAGSDLWSQGFVIDFKSSNPIKMGMNRVINTGYKIPFGNFEGFRIVLN